MSTRYVIVRGAKNSVDPTYNCMAHDTSPNNYLALEVQNDRVVNRRLYRAAERGQLESFVRNAAQNTDVVVECDMRKDKGLLPFTPPPNALSASLATYRRAKSDSEIEHLNALADMTYRQIHSTNKSNEFRGSSSKVGDNVKAAHAITKTRGFVQYRGGFQMPSGLKTDLTRVEARTADWQSRLDRVNRGLDAVEKELKAGVSVTHLNNVFMDSIDDTEDRVYGNVVFSTGYEGREEGVPLDVLHAYDCVTVGAAVKSIGGKDVALIYRAVHNIEPPPPPELEYGSLSSEPSLPVIEPQNVMPPPAPLGILPKAKPATEWLV